MKRLLSAAKYLFLVLLIIKVISFFSNTVEYSYTANHGLSWEAYDPAYYLRYTTINSIIEDADENALGSKNSLSYYEYVSNIIRFRFYHGYSYYSMKDNPIAFIAGKTVWKDLSAIVIPDDIMKHPMAACSQQSLVLMEIFKRNGVDYRKVGFKHHFTVEAFIEGQWRYYDTDMEPELAGIRTSLKDMLSKGKIVEAYKNLGWKPEEIYKFLGHPTYGRLNANPAPRGSIFQKTCYFFTSWYFLTGLFLLLILHAVQDYLKRQKTEPVSFFTALIPAFGFSRRRKA